MEKSVKLKKIVSMLLAIIMTLGLFTLNVSAAAVNIVSMAAENSEEACVLTVTRSKTGAITKNDFNLVYSINGSSAKALAITSFASSGKVVTIKTAPFAQTNVEQVITITEKNEKKSVTFTVPAITVTPVELEMNIYDMAADNYFRLYPVDWDIVSITAVADGVSVPVAQSRLSDRTDDTIVLGNSRWVDNAWAEVMGSIDVFKTAAWDELVLTATDAAGNIYTTTIINNLVDDPEPPSELELIVFEKDYGFQLFADGWDITSVEIKNFEGAAMSKVYNSSSASVPADAIAFLYNKLVPGTGLTSGVVSIDIFKNAAWGTLTVTAYDADGKKAVVTLESGYVEPEPEEPEPGDAKLIDVWREMLGEDGMSMGQYSPYGLFDEFENISYPPTAADGYKPPIDPNESVNANTWRIGGNAPDWVKPEVTVDLMRDVKLLEIYLYDGERYAPSFWHQYLELNNITDDPNDPGSPYEVSGGKFYIYSGSDLLVEYDIENSGEWVKFEFPDGITTDTLRFVKESGGEQYFWTNLPAGTYGYLGPYICDANIVEVALYGVSIGEDPVRPDPEEPDPIPDPQPSPDFGLTFGDFVGTNGFFDMPVDLYKNMGFIREYHNWRWSEGACGEIEGFTNTAETDNPQIVLVDRWNNSFKDFYERMKNLGVGVYVCIQGSTDGTLRPNWQGTKDSTDPHSYYAHAASLFQYAARFGSNKDVPAELISFGGGTSNEWGLGLLEYLENWNEPNATWEPANKQFTPQQFAAMTSADYDGHMNSMGPGVGVKNADPDMKFVMGGLAGISLDYLRDMYKWFKENRTLEQWIEINGTEEGYQMIPFEVLNVHHYSTDPKTNTGITPEEDGFYERNVELVDFRNRYFPGTEVWLSEFGYDSGQGSRQSATVEYTRNGVLFNEGINVGLDGREVQGRWVVRSFILLAAAGVDRAQQFMLRDSSTNNPESPGVYDTCGLVGFTEVNGVRSYPKKPSWYYVYTMKYWLDNMVFDQELETGADDMLAYQFVETDGSGTKAISIWCTTKTVQVVPDYELALPDGTVSAKLVTMADKKDFGIVTDLEIVDGAVTIEVSEKPVFVIAYTTEQEPEPEPTSFPSKLDIAKPADDATMIFENDFSALADEPIETNTIPNFGFYNLNSAEVISIDPNDAAKGKALKIENKDGGEFSINGLTGLSAGETYAIEYQFYVADDFTVPVMMLSDGAAVWNALTVRSGNLSIRGTWDTAAVDYTNNAWHHIKIEMTQLAGGTVNCSFYFDGEYKFDYTAADSRAVSRLMVYLRTGNGTAGTTYISNLYFYKLAYKAPSERIMLDASMAYKAFGTYDANNVASVPGNVCAIQDSMGDPLNGDFVNINTQQTWHPTAPQTDRKNVV